MNGSLWRSMKVGCWRRNCVRRGSELAIDYLVIQSSCDFACLPFWTSGPKFNCYFLNS